MYLTRGLTMKSATEAKTTALIAPDSEVDEDGLLFLSAPDPPQWLIVLE